MLSIYDTYLGRVIDIQEPYNVWKKLEEMFRCASQSNIDVILCRYQGITMNDEEMIMEYRNRLSSLETRLEIIGHEITESDKRRTLLNGLREDFDVTGDIIRGIEKSRRKLFHSS